MVAVKQPRSIPQELEMRRPRSTRSFELLQGSLSTRKIARHSPVVASFHRVVDGILLGVFIATTAISALTLHWQNQWTLAFTRLEGTRSLAHRFTESTAALESHLLNRNSMPDFIVPIKVSNLLYLDHPSKAIDNFGIDNPSLISRISKIPIRHGY